MKLPVFLVLAPLFLLISCSKGYEVRFANYSTERMDSVIIGNDKLIFTNVERQTETDYSGIKNGNYAVVCVSESKKRYSSSINLSKNGHGKRIIQIDGTGTIDILED
jgi:hypothetical protein